MKKYLKTKPGSLEEAVLISRGLIQEVSRRSTKLIGPAKDHLKKLGLKQKGDVVYDKGGKYYGYVDKIYHQGSQTPFLHKVVGIDKRPYDQSPPVYKHQRPSNVRYIPSIDGMTGRPFKDQ